MLNRRIAALSKYFIDRNNGSIDSKKLQKLCYYTQAWHLALNDTRFIETDFEAWIHGPVCPELWIACKNAPCMGIREVDLNLQGINIKEEFDDEEIDFLDSVWDTYGEFSGYQLEMMTHREDPWLNQRKGLECLKPSKNKITDNDMRIYYRNIYAEAENT